MMRYDYTLTIRCPRRLTPEELEAICRVAVDEAARRCGVSEEARRHVRRGLVVEPPIGEETQAA